MARKGNQHKNGLDRNSANHKKEVPDSGFGSPNTKRKGKLSERKLFSEDEPQSDNGSRSTVSESLNQTDHVVDGEKSEHKSKKSLRKDKQSMGGVEHLVPSDKDSGDCIETFSETGSSGSKEEKGRLASSIRGSKHSKRNSGRFANGLRRYDMMSNIEFSDALILRYLRILALSILETATNFMERHKPLFITLKTHVSSVVCYSRKKIEYAYPIVLKWLVQLRNTVQKKIRYAYPIILRWLMHLGNLVLLLGMVWLDCSLRGVDSFLRMGTTSFFSVIWCSILSIIAMIGISKFLVVLVLSTLAGLVLGFTIAVLLIGTTGIALLWFYGSFWTTSLFICAGGLAFMLSHERLALLITTLYSIYCAWTYVGWLGLLLAMNLSFVSSDALIFFLKNNMDDHRRPDQPNEQPDGMYNQPSFYAQQESTETGFGSSADRSPGVPSTSGNDSELTSEDEVIRLLNCTDHYSALGLSRYENVDVSILKREYRKKAMLVHPDKNMGNEKAADAFKKLQNAYEVLLDSLKRKTYDDELRREEVLNYFRRFQNTSQKNGRHSFFAPGFARTEADDDDPFGESRRIACKKCGNFHVWIHSKKSKSTARWCQDCKDFHPAKDGDGWVEQSTQPFLFGMMQKVDAPRAFVCADSKIYDATEWYICQGMRCSVNTHKPSFHVNTSLTPKHGTGKGTSPGQRGGPMPSNMEEHMTEEEFFEWLQNAMQAGVFENFAAGGPSDESPSARAGNFSKSGGGSSASSNSSKRKKKGKKQR